MSPGRRSETWLAWGNTWGNRAKIELGPFWLDFHHITRAIQVSASRPELMIHLYRGRWGAPGSLGGGGGRMGLHKAIFMPVLEPNIAVFKPTIQVI